MKTFLLLALMQVSAFGAEQLTFEQAYQRSVATGRPLVVLIGATWCPGCQTMKNATLPQVAEAGGLDEVVFHYLDFDQHRQRALQIRRAKPIPQLIRFDRTPTGWKSKFLVGAKSPRQVHEFLNDGLAAKTPNSPASPTEPPLATKPVSHPQL